MSRLALSATGCVIAGFVPVATAEAAIAGPDEASESPFRLSGIVFGDAASVGGKDWKGEDTVHDIRLAELRLQYQTETFIALAGYDAADEGGWTDVGILARVGSGLIGFGQFKEPAAISKMALPESTVGLEAPRFTSTFGMGRRLGVHALTQNGPFLFQAALTNGSIDETDATGRGPGQTAVSLRGSTAIENERGVFHLGAYARWLDYDGAGLKLGAGPHSAIVGKTAYTALTPYYGREAERSTMLGAEFAATRGRWFVSAEAARMSVDLPGSTETISGAALQASVALTGEQRRYFDIKGAFKHIKPDRPLGDGGFGAVELTARVDHLDLAPLIDGSSTAVGFGVTWTPREDLRVMARYEEEFGRGAMPDTRSLGIRIQVGF